MSRELRSDIKELQIAVYQSLGLPEGRRAAQEAGFVSPNTCVIMNLSDRAGALLTQPLRSVEKGTICSLMAMAKKGSVSTVLVRWLGKGRPWPFVACCQIIIIKIIIQYSQTLCSLL